MKPKVYIAGKITGMEHEAAKLFAEAELQLRRMGFDPVNPMKLNHNHDKSWHSYMRVCMQAMVNCDAVYFMGNWESSKGARFEHDVAVTINLTRLYNLHEQLQHH